MNLGIRKLTIALVIAVSLPHVAIAENRAEFSSAHLAEAERLVYALGVAESMSIPTNRFLQKVRDNEPEKGELMTAVMSPFIEKKYIGLGLREFMASQFDMESCRLLSEHWEGPVGRKFVGTQIQLLSTGKAPEITFTPTEEAIGKSFEKTAAFQDFMRAQPAIQQKIGAFAKEIKEKMAQRMRDELARRSETATRN